MEENFLSSQNKDERIYLSICYLIQYAIKLIRNKTERCICNYRCYIFKVYTNFKHYIENIVLSSQIPMYIVHNIINFHKISC